MFNLTSNQANANCNYDRMSLYTRQISKTLKSDNTHGGAGKEFSYTTGRYIHWYDHFGKILKIGIFYATAIILVAIHEHGKMGLN